MNDTAKRCFSSYRGFRSVFYWLSIESKLQCLLRWRLNIKLEKWILRNVETSNLFFFRLLKHHATMKNKRNQAFLFHPPHPHTQAKNLLSSPSISCSGDRNLCTLASDTSSASLSTSISLNESFEEKSIPNDISTACAACPIQPTLIKYPVNHQKRSFQSSWYTQRKWLDYSVENDACYFHYCRHFSSSKLNADDAFTTLGFNNWKKALDKVGGLIRHESSQSHIVATKNYLSYKQRQETDSNRAIQIRKNRVVL